MWNALYAFENPADAQAAEHALAKAGVDAAAVRRHGRYTGDPGDTAEKVDEQVTGGLISNVLNLFQGVFDWSGSPHDAASYEAVINRGGVVLDVHAADDAERERVDAAIASRTSRRSGWREVR